MYVIWHYRNLRGAFPHSPHDTWTCPHTTEQPQIACIPWVVHTCGENGTSRRRRLVQLPSIRSCCRADALQRAGWWNHIDALLDSLVIQGGISLGPQRHPVTDKDIKRIRIGLTRLVSLPTLAERTAWQRLSAPRRGKPRTRSRRKA
jgi:hypothetical protein